MRLLSWNCRGLGGPTTISQLKESMRLYLPDVMFICETKQKCDFIGTVCRELKLDNCWNVVEPVGKKGGLLVTWGEGIQIKRIIKMDFCIELQIESDGSEDSFWAIFVHASTT